MAHVQYEERGNARVAINSSVALGQPMCVNGTPWILFLLEECVENAWEYWSVVIGLVSMMCFMLSTLPQVYEAYKNGRVEEAISVGFLLFILNGDITNFVGCYLTRQLPIQIITAVFYIFTDIILISQFLYYKLKNSTHKTSSLKWVCFLWCGLAAMAFVVLPKLVEDRNVGISREDGSASRTVRVSGYACGYLSSMFYLASRLPQLYKNFKRQSTEGTSYMLFALAMLGNGTYGLSLILVLPALNGSKGAFILNHLSWLIGSLGVLLLDFFITAQFIMYRKQRLHSQLALKNIAEVEPLLFGEKEL